MRTSIIVSVLLGAAVAANGAFMLAAPAAWYGAVPGVTETGPFNPHFVRDIGAAYLTCGIALAWFAARPTAWPAAVIAALFLAVHALIHLWDALAGRETWRALVVDLPGVFLPPALVAWIVFSNRSSSHDPLVPESSA